MYRTAMSPTVAEYGVATHSKEAQQQHWRFVFRRHSTSVGDSPADGTAINAIIENLEASNSGNDATVQLAIARQCSSKTKKIIKCSPQYTCTYFAKYSSFDWKVEQDN